MDPTDINKVKSADSLENVVVGAKRSIEAEVKDRLALEHEKRITKQKHKPKKVYAYFINCNNVRPNWQPINQPEKKKDKFGYY